MAVAFGGTVSLLVCLALTQIVNTPRITHGHEVRVVPVSPALGLFGATEFPEEARSGFDAVVYNSLAVGDVPAELEVTAWSDPRNGSAPTIQGLMHKEHPIWGVQYHPEVSCSAGLS
jgi:anthranilate/para-aminobenzoate synthase component II